MKIIKKKTLTSTLKKVSDDLSDTRNSLDVETNLKVKLGQDKTRLETSFDELKRALDEAKAKIDRLEKEKKIITKTIG